MHLQARVKAKKPTPPPKEAPNDDPPPSPEPPVSPSRDDDDDAGGPAQPASPGGSHWFKPPVTGATGATYADPTAEEGALVGAAVGGCWYKDSLMSTAKGREEVAWAGGWCCMIRPNPDNVSCPGHWCCVRYAWSPPAEAKDPGKWRLTSALYSSVHPVADLADTARQQAAVAFPQQSHQPRCDG